MGTGEQYQNWYAEYSLIGGLFTNDFVCRFGRYMRGITAWASTAFGQGELLVAGGKLQRRTVARGSHGVHQSLRQFGVYVIWSRMTICRFNFTRYWYAEYSLIGGLFTNDFVCRFGRYMRGITAWASTAFGQGELLVAGGKLQRRTVARGSHGVHQSLRQFGVYVIWSRMTKRNCLFCLVC